MYRVLCYIMSLYIFLIGNYQAIPPVLSRQSSHASTDSSGSMLEFSATSLDSQRAYLIATLTEILSSHENALMKMKTALQQKLRSKPVRKSDRKLRRKFTPLVDSPVFEETKTVYALFNYTLLQLELEGIQSAGVSCDCVWVQTCTRKTPGVHRQQKASSTIHSSAYIIGRAEHRKSARASNGTRSYESEERFANAGGVR